MSLYIYTHPIIFVSLENPDPYSIEVAHAHSHLLSYKTESRSSAEHEVGEERKEGLRKKEEILHKNGSENGTEQGLFLCIKGIYLKEN